MIPKAEIAGAIAFLWWWLDLNIVDASLALEAVEKKCFKIGIITESILHVMGVRCRCFIKLEEIFQVAHGEMSFSIRFIVNNFIA